MTPITVKLTSEELELLSSLASDQLFRREFIDPKMPGHKSNPGAIRLGKQLVERLQSMADQSKGPSARRNGPALKMPGGALSGSAVNGEHDSGKEK